MEFLQEGIALGIDLFVLGMCIKEYTTYRKHINSLKAAPQLTIDGDLKNLVAQQKDKKLPYVVVRGRVTPIGDPMRCIMAPSVTGVVQIVKLNEHRIARGFAGFWTEQRKLLHLSSNEMPFELRSNDQGVEIMDAISAAILDMDVVYDNYEPTSLSFFDHIFGFFSGVRQKGLQTTEEVLRDGSLITAVGELELDGKSLRLQPSPSGPLLLTTATKTSLIKKFEGHKTSTLIKLFVCGTVSVILVTLIVRKLYQRRKQQRDDRNLKATLEKERRERRARARPSMYNLKPEQLCVVCSTNPKEVIILPCGHVCLCEDCALKIKTSCPVCRAKIKARAAAFIV